MEPKYKIANLIETSRGSTGRIIAIRQEFNQEEGKEPWESVCYRIAPFVGAKGFFIPESDVTRVLADS